MLCRRRWLFIIALFLGAGPLWATPPHTIQKVPVPSIDSDQEVKSFEQKVLDVGDFLTDHLDRTAEAIDLTLAGQDYLHKPNQTRAVFSEMATYGEAKKVSNSGDFNLNLRLPNVERRWALRFSSYDEEREERDLSQRRVRTRSRERDYGAGLGFFQKLGRVRVSFLPRLQLKNPLQMAYTLRFQSDADLHWVQVSPRLDLFADAIKGTGEYAEMPLRFRVNRRSAISFVNSEEYRANLNYFITQHELAYDYTLTYNSGCGASLNATAIRQGAYHLDDLTASISYGQEVYTDRFRYGVAPFLDFSKGYAFKGKAGISVTADLIF
jgi:hypothetical protein